MSRVKKGLAAEFIAKAKFLLEGWNIYDEVNYDSKVDFIIEKNNNYFRIQVKCVTKEGTIPFRKLTHSKTTHKQHHYSCKDVDFFVGVDILSFDVYVIPITKISKSVTSINKLEEYKNNFNLEPCCVNITSAFPQIGETFDNGNAELADESQASVETLRGISKHYIVYDNPNIISDLWFV